VKAPEYPDCVAVNDDGVCAPTDTASGDDGVIVGVIVTGGGAMTFTLSVL
jgi:hypothetical protein